MKPMLALAAAATCGVLAACGGGNVVTEPPVDPSTGNDSGEQATGNDSGEQDNFGPWLFHNGPDEYFRSSHIHGREPQDLQGLYGFTTPESGTSAHTDTIEELEQYINSVDYSTIPYGFDVTGVLGSTQWKDGLCAGQLSTTDCQAEISYVATNDIQRIDFVQTRAKHWVQGFQGSPLAATKTHNLFIGTMSDDHQSKGFFGISGFLTRGFNNLEDYDYGGFIGGTIPDSPTEYVLNYNTSWSGNAIGFGRMDTPLEGNLFAGTVFIKAEFPVYQTNNIAQEVQFTAEISNLANVEHSDNPTYDFSWSLTRYAGPDGLLLSPNDDGYILRMDNGPFSNISLYASGIATVNNGPTHLLGGFITDQIAGSYGAKEGYYARP